MAHFSIPGSHRYSVPMTQRWLTCDFSFMALRGLCIWSWEESFVDCDQWISSNILFFCLQTEHPSTNDSKGIKSILFTHVVNTPNTLPSRAVGAVFRGRMCGECYNHLCRSVQRFHRYQNHMLTHVFVLVKMFLKIKISPPLGYFFLSLLKVPRVTE